jgi:hypothetical protein
MRPDRTVFAFAGLVSFAIIVRELLASTIPAMRTIVDDASLVARVALAAFGFVIAAGTVWFARRRDRPEVFLVLAPLVALVSWVAGLARLESFADRTPPTDDLGGRVADVLLGCSVACDYWHSGATLAVVLLSLAAFSLGARVRASHPNASPRRALGLATGTILLALVVAALFTVRVGAYPPLARAEVLLAVLPAVLGIVGVFVASGAPADVGLVVIAALFALGAVVAKCVLRDLAAAADLHYDVIPHAGATALSEVRWYPLYVAPFCVPVLGAAAVTTGVAARVSARALVTVVAPGLAVLVIFGGATARWVEAFHTASEIPIQIANAPLAIGEDGSCAALPISRLVHVDAKGVRSPSFSVDFDATGGCAAVVAAIAKATPDDDPWLEVDEVTPAERVACIFDELARLYGPRTQGRTAQLARAGTTTGGCAVHLVGRGGAAGSAVCRSVLVPDPRCRELPAYDAEPEGAFDLALGAAPLLRRTYMEHTRSAIKVPRDRLASVLRDRWRTYGSHLDPHDRKFDVLVVRTAPGSSFGDVMRAVHDVDEVTREVPAYTREWDGAMRTMHVFDLALASSSYRSQIGDDARLPPFEISPSMTPPERAAASRAATTADNLCVWGGCSRRVRAELFLSRRPSNDLAAGEVVRLLDPDVDVARFQQPPPPNVADGGADAGANRFVTPLNPWVAPPVVELHVVDPDRLDPAALASFADDVRRELLFAAGGRAILVPVGKPVTVTANIAQGNVVWAVSDPPNVRVSMAFEYASPLGAAVNGAPVFEVTLTPARYAPPPPRP